MVSLEDKISLFMRLDPPIVNLHDDVLLIQELFSREGNTHILVVEDRIPVGIISLSDLMFHKLDEVFPAKNGKDVTRKRQ